ncbi:MAG TPA: ABC transporter permease [Rhodospirillales bacterium]|jgi:NitT/TauT family transport system permease protein|nr:MAG: ABC transporter permease [Rhodospirillaceae bacterium]PPR71657.1 MAG: putative aliphatic sulfonates transport permease protein SsuC [Alphaproteobacteria bacterium MarineAlpha3_Bin2]HIC28739.1 ABC transporter permease [Rhodospirillales bacterium]HIM76788.1 ABC transporter permease [Rhodospirillales bacterium]
MADPGNRLSESRIRVFSAVVFLAVWQVGAELADTRMLPDPWQVVQGVLDHIADGELLHHVGVTLARVGVSFFIAMAFGTALGMVMGSNRRWDAALDGVLVLALNIPALVVIILCYLWFGLGEFAAILAVAINKFPIVVVTMREGARAVDRDLLQVARAFRIEPKRTFFRVYLPQLYPYLLASARSGLALVWKIVLVVELLGRSDGVGFQLGVFFQFFDITSILAYSFAFIAVVMAIELFVLAPLDRRLSAWRT